tara:strand:+ start:305 stop:1141 length:837 start_codon:yes stop_codon:yes gene_type:complete
MKALTPKKAKQPKEEGAAPIQKPRPLWLNDFPGSPYNFLVWIFSPDRRAISRSFMSEDKDIGEFSNADDLTNGSPKNSSHVPFRPPSTPWVYSGIGKGSKGAERGHEKGIWPYKKAFTSNPKGTKKSYKEQMELHCWFCMVQDEKEIRKCKCYECPFWRYRTSKRKVHRAMLGGLKKGEALGAEELTELQELKESVQAAEVRVIALANEHCKRKAGWFRKAYSGKSRAAAIKAEELYLANYDVDQVVPFDEWLEDEVEIWLKWQENNKKIEPMEGGER